MRRIIDTNTNKTIWRGEEYLVDNKPAYVDPPLFLLDEVDRLPPSFNEETEKLIIAKPFADIANREWVQFSFEVKPLTEEEIAERSRKVWPTVADFWNEFTNQEKYDIETSSDGEIIVIRADLKLWVKEVWSDDLRVIAGLDKLVASGIISSERKLEILEK